LGSLLVLPVSCWGTVITVGFFVSSACFILRHSHHCWVLCQFCLFHTGAQSSLLGSLSVLPVSYWGRVITVGFFVSSACFILGHSHHC
jgi:hypothetical protein